MGTLYEAVYLQGFAQEPNGSKSYASEAADGFCVYARTISVGGEFDVDFEQDFDSRENAIDYATLLSDWLEVPLNLE